MTGHAHEPAHDSARESAGRVLDLAHARTPTLGVGRLVCLDGPAGTGKTTLAAALAALAPGTVVVGMDDLYDGWGGLPGLGPTLTGVVAPLAAGRPGRYRRWDWHADARGEEVTVPVADLVVLEGVGSYDRGLAELVTLLVWLDAPRHVRTSRVLARDGAASAAHLARWQADEEVHHARHGTAAAADLRLRLG